MKPFTRLTSRLAPLPIKDVDTDQIIPANYLKATTKEGLAEGLFARWSRRPDGSPRQEFPLNRPEHQGAEILLAGDNFGCGSSREHAAWALIDQGFRAVISTSFADIFSNNALKNGLLPATVDEKALEELFTLVADDPSQTVTIQLDDQTVTFPDGHPVSFPIDTFSKICLLEGIDQLGYLLKNESEITAFEQRREKRGLAHDMF
jgi:3-isopropylmalate/(R)-2-methylmalate dehydratase small subunit